VIQIESLLIEEFRGIRRLHLHFNKETYAICGPNGTGKSGVVDALEFALTGDISRLTGEGTDGITVKSHAPHVDKRNAPHKARVVLQAYLPKLGRSFTLERTVGTAKAPKLTPNDTDVMAAVSDLGKHPEFALTRREIIKYILATPNNRAKAVQALLRLEEIEKVRFSLNSIHNATTREATNCETALGESRRLLLQALGITELRKAAVLEAVNAYRAVISLGPLADLEATTSLKQGMSSATARKPKVVKQQASTDLTALIALLDVPLPEAIQENLSQVRKIFETLRASPNLLASLKRESFLRNGLSLIESGACPFCDAEWEQSLLRDHVQGKLDEAKQASSLKDELRMAAQPVEEHYRDIEARIASILGHADGLDSSLSRTALKKFAEDLKDRRAMLQSLNDIETSIRQTTTITGDRSRDVDGELSRLKDAVTALPELSKEDAARDQLTLC